MSRALTGSPALPRSPWPLVRELLDMQATMGGNGRVRMGVDGYGHHDDLVIALAPGLPWGWRVRENSVSQPWSFRVRDDDSVI